MSLPEVLPRKPTVKDRLHEGYRSLQRGARKMTRQLRNPGKTSIPLPATKNSAQHELFNRNELAVLSWPEMQTQWWYFTGQLKCKDSKDEFGFQSVFFERHAHHDFVGPLPTRLLKSEYFVSHCALSHISAIDIQKSFRYHQRGGVAQKHFGSASENQFEIQVDHWKAYSEDNAFQLFICEGKEKIKLQLTPTKALIRHGERGYFEKSIQPEDSSYYCSYTRMKAEGEIRIDERNFEVVGQAWMDHEKMSCQDEVFHHGWDWFSLQFDNHSELMIYRIRDSEGKFSFMSAATFVDPEGRTTPVSSFEMEFQILETWKSHQSGAVYPVTQHIRIPKLELSIVVRPRLMAQEMDTCRSSFCTYWEGSVTCEAKFASKMVKGLGYVELVGYDPRPHAKILKLLTLT